MNEALSDSYELIPREVSEANQSARVGRTCSGITGPVHPTQSLYPL